MRGHASHEERKLQVNLAGVRGHWESALKRCLALFLVINPMATLEFSHQEQLDPELNCCVESSGPQISAFTGREVSFPPARLLSHFSSREKNVKVKLHNL